MKAQTKADFKMTGVPAFTVSSDSKLPYETLHSAAGEPFMVPTKGKNVSGAKEFLRTMLSKEAAESLRCVRRVSQTMSLSAAAVLW
ncbi:hypothetical protein [Renibacterium salmoninarum]|uniref:hypothetical protein n=1 Tax=Renibacterium salmoninarum TaxID=1646 RepID=UPI0002EE41EE|nr:hypothetical protein [Renibacterium salmoninarum]